MWLRNRVALIFFNVLTYLVNLLLCNFVLLKIIYMDKTKKEQIKEWLDSGKPITALMAIQMFGCTNLSSIIYRLRKEGYNIDTERLVNSNGVFVRYVMSK